ncbi:hypothetical protein ED312_23205 [Sinomicrobium pectinilyticum]|uniref:Uncharacterized protein n=1 Tax=Sinomicrobium pectinilyticum TaxID=1084421 RepID=A0A3N0CZ43_SINP1|nr:hypothetical protein ED312_23205 [Sinomicrobium pectinilyticum]
MTELCVRLLLLIVLYHSNPWKLTKLQKKNGAFSFSDTDYKKKGNVVKDRRGMLVVMIYTFPVYLLNYFLLKDSC